MKVKTYIISQVQPLTLSSKTSKIPSHLLLSLNTRMIFLFWYGNKYSTLKDDKMTTGKCVRNIDNDITNLLIQLLQKYFIWCEIKYWPLFCDFFYK